MGRGILLLASCALGIASGQDGESGALLQQVAENVNGQISRLTDYACHQTIDRFARFGPEKPWDKVDSLKLEVGMSGDRELYSWAGAGEFQEVALSELVRRGVVGTGHYALLARHVFRPGGGGQFRYKGVTEIDGGQAHEWSFDFPLEQSRYRLRTAHAEAVVPFQGAVWADPETHSLVRLEVHAYDLPEKLALVEASNIIRYQPARIGDAEVTLPAASELLLVFNDGNETLNRLRLSDCRQFRGEAVLSFAEPSAREQPAAPADSAAPALPKYSLLEVELAEDLEPATCTIGQPVKVRMARALKDGERIVAPAGSEVAARLVRLEKQDQPYPLWEIGIELESLRVGQNEIPFQAVLIDAGPESGLIRQSKTLMPTFTKRRGARLDILVRETPKNQGILHWDARRPRTPKGLRMKWRVE